MNRCRAIKTDLPAGGCKQEQIDTLGDLLTEIESHSDFTALAAKPDRAVSRSANPLGVRPPNPATALMRIVVLKQPYDFSDELERHHVADRTSHKRLCGLAHANIIGTERTTAWMFDRHIGETRAMSVFDGAPARLTKKDFSVREGVRCLGNRSQVAGVVFM